VNLVATRDNTLYDDGLGQTSNGSGIHFFAGVTGFGGIRRGVVAFDTSGIPIGSTVTSVQLRLRMSMTSADPYPVVTHRVLASWGEGTSNAGMGEGAGTSATTNDATWLHRFYPSVYWAAPGGDFDPAVSANIVVSGTGYYYWGPTPGMIADVQGWVNDPSTSQGWILITEESFGPTAKRFDTREISTTTYRPRLTVTYLPPPPASVVSVGAGCVGSSGLPFTLGTLGLPEVSNQGFALTFSNGPASGTAWLFAADSTAAPTPLTGGCLVHLETQSAFALIASGASPFGPFALGSGGDALLPITLGMSQGLIGSELSLQALSADPAIPFLTTNALTLTIGP
jgi:hypothetical protein